MSMATTPVVGWVFGWGGVHPIRLTCGGTIGITEGIVNSIVNNSLSKLVPLGALITAFQVVSALLLGTANLPTFATRPSCR